MNKGISVILCCYNSVARLKPTLEYLSKLLVHKFISWEVIVVDNNSVDHTAEYALSVWKDLGLSVPLRVISEKQQGISYTRVKGILSAKYEYVLFCDDDNWLDSNYLIRVFEIFETQPTVAIIGGEGQAICEIPPPEWFIRLKGNYYACSELSQQSGIINTKVGVVYGAGMAVKKSIFERLIESGFVFSLTGRKGELQLMGEEIELGLMLRILGYDIWYDKLLLFKHFITKDRLDKDYFKKLRDNYGIALCYLSPYYHTLLGYPSSRVFYLSWIIKSILITPIRSTYKFLFGSYIEQQAALHQFVTIQKILRLKIGYLERRKKILKIKKNFLKRNLINN